TLFQYGSETYRDPCFIDYVGYFENSVGTMDGRISGFKDVRDSNFRSSVRVQRYYFVHTARYFVLTYRSATGSTSTHQGRDLARHLAMIYDSSDNQLYEYDVPTNTTATVDLIVDLGPPTYTNKWLDLRIGWAKSWTNADDYIRFRINTVGQTDFIRGDMMVNTYKEHGEGRVKVLFLVDEEGIKGKMLGTQA